MQHILMRQAPRQQRAAMDHNARLPLRAEEVSDDPWFDDVLATADDTVVVWYVHDELPSGLNQAEIEGVEAM